MKDSPLMHFVFFYLEPISFFLPVPFLLYYSFTDKRARIKALMAYYLIATLIMLKANGFNMKYSNNIDDYRLLNVFTCLAMCFYFFTSLVDRWKKAFVVFCGVTNIVYFISYTLTIEKSNSLDSLGSILVSLTVVMMVFLFMHQTLSNVTDEPLSNNFNFWFVACQMLYHCGAFIIFLTYGYFTKKIQTAGQYTLANRYLLMHLWNGHNILLFISSLMICASILWITWRKKHPRMFKP